MYADVSQEEDGDEEADVTSERLDRVQGNLRDWVQKEEVRRIMKLKFRHFLRTFRNPKDESKVEYIERIEQMMESEWGGGGVGGGVGMGVGVGGGGGQILW